MQDWPGESGKGVRSVAKGVSSIHHSGEGSSANEVLGERGY